MPLPCQTGGGMDSNKAFRADFHKEAHKFFGDYFPSNTRNFSDSHALYLTNSIILR